MVQKGTKCEKGIRIMFWGDVIQQNFLNEKVCLLSKLCQWLLKKKPQTYSNGSNGNIAFKSKGQTIQCIGFFRQTGARDQDRKGTNPFIESNKHPNKA